jgi:DnaK suppressor protein
MLGSLDGQIIEIKQDGLCVNVGGKKVLLPENSFGDKIKITGDTVSVLVGNKLSSFKQTYDPRTENDDEYMCETQRAFFKVILIAYLYDTQLQLSANIAGEDTDRRSTDESDNMSIEMQNLQELRRKDRIRKLAIKIEEFITKIDQDIYGFCEESGNEIGINRLLMRPIARYCVEVQERKDIEEKEKEYIDYNQDERPTNSGREKIDTNDDDE